MSLSRPIGCVTRFTRQVASLLSTKKKVALPHRICYRRLDARIPTTAPIAPSTFALISKPKTKVKTPARFNGPGFHAIGTEALAKGKNDCSAFPAMLPNMTPSTAMNNISQICGRCLRKKRSLPSNAKSVSMSNSVFPREFLYGRNRMPVQMMETATLTGCTKSSQPILIV